MRDLCGTRQVRTLVLQESRSYVIHPTTACRGHFVMHCSPQQQDDPTPRLGVTLAKNANQRDPRASADAESTRNDLSRAPCPQDILKVRPPNSLDYRARYDTPALQSSFPTNLIKKCHRKCTRMHYIQQKLIHLYLVDNWCLEE